MLLFIQRLKNFQCLTLYHIMSGILYMAVPRKMFPVLHSTLTIYRYTWKKFDLVRSAPYSILT